jgi:hypothetical protein
LLATICNSRNMDMTGIYTDGLLLGPSRKLVARRTFLCIERVSEMVECRPRALTDELVRYGSDVYSDSGDESIEIISLISQTTGAASTADDDKSIADDKSSVACQSTASTTDGDDRIRSISFTSQPTEDSGSEFCDTASGDTDDVISVRSCVTNEDWDMVGINADGLPLGQSTQAASTAHDNDSIQSSLLASKSTEDSSTDSMSTEFAGNVEEPHGKAQPSGEERTKAKSTRSWQKSGRARQREKARRRERTPSPRRIA